jgi:hypothetical protein
MNEALKKPRYKGNNILKKHRFGMGKYHLMNICLFSTAAIVVLYWSNLFNNISLWWTLCLIPLFLNRFRFIVTGSVVLAIFVIYKYWSEISAAYIPLLFGAIYLGHISAVFIHNAVHNNFNPTWINPIIGELCALQQVSAGYPIFQLVHNEHHSHSDDPNRDPHPTKGYSFWEFVDISRTLILNRVAAIYFEKWGDNKKTQKYWKTQSFLILLSRFSKTFFIFVLLEPKLFVLLFLPSYLSNVFLFAAFNYFTHKVNNQGNVNILNLDNNLYYKVCNRILFGVYFHKNHHLKPKLFNPMHLTLKNE